MEVGLPPLNNISLAAIADLDGDGWEDFILGPGLIFQNLEGQKFQNVSDLSNLTDIANLRKTEKVTGDILELGTWLGGFTILMAKYLNLIKSDKKIITCDSFEGMPKKITKLGEDYPAGLLKVDYEFVKEKFRTYSVDNRVTIIKGFIEKSLQTMKEKNFSFAFIDTAAYDSMKTALEFIYPTTHFM